MFSRTQLTSMLSRNKSTIIKEETHVRNIVSRENAIESCYKYIANYQKNMSLDISNPMQIKQELEGLIRLFVEKKPMFVEGFIDNNSCDTEALTNFLIVAITEYGKINKPYYDNQVNEIRINGAEIIIESKNKETFLKDEDGNLVTFDSPDEALNVINKLLSNGGRQLTLDNKLSNASTLEGFRVAAMHTEVHTRERRSGKKWPSAVIRKFPDDIYTAADLVAFGSLSVEFVELLILAVKSKRTLIISGGTGTGKTSILELIVKYIKDRIFAIEDPAELHLRKYDSKDNVVNDIISTVADDSELSKENNGTTEGLLNQTLRYSSKALILSESRRDREIAKFIQSANIGFYAYSTIHSDSARRSVNRLTTAYMSAMPNITEGIAMTSVTEAIAWIVSTEKLEDGSRKGMEVAAVMGVKMENGVLVPILRTIIEYRIEGTYIDPETGEKRIKGNHYIVGNLPEELVTILKKRMVDPELYEKFTNIAENVPVKCSYDYNAEDFKKFEV